jgi:hypothetical protein
MSKKKALAEFYGCSLGAPAAEQRNPLTPLSGLHPKVNKGHLIIAKKA